MTYPKDIRDAMLAAGCPEESIDTTPPEKVFDFMLAKHGLAGWGDYLRGLAANTIAQPEQHPEDVFKVGDPMPQHLGLVADLYSDTRQARLREEKRVSNVKGRESELREYLIANLEKSEGTGAIGQTYKAVIKEDRKPRIAEDGWDKLHKFIADNGRFDLLQKRMNDKAIMDMYAAGEMPPGVETALIPSVSITKI